MIPEEPSERLLAAPVSSADVNNRPHWADKVMAAFTGLIFLTYIASDYFLWSQMRLSQDALHASQRPWVNAASATLMKPLELPPKRFSVFLNVVMRNSGVSVATDGIAFFYVAPNATETLDRTWKKPCETVDSQREAMRASHQVWSTGFVLVPGESATLPIGTFSDDVPLDSIAAGLFYILGCATYSDSFGMPHRTRFCFMPTGPVTDPAKVTFKVCNAFQEAT